MVPENMKDYDPLAVAMTLSSILDKLDEGEKDDFLNWFRHNLFGLEQVSFDIKDQNYGLAVSKITNLKSDLQKVFSVFGKKAIKR